MTDSARSTSERDRGHGHGHGHGSGDGGPASRRVRRTLAFVLVPFAIASLVGVALLYPFGSPHRSGSDLGFGRNPVDGVIVAAAESSCSTAGSDDSPSEPAGKNSGCLRMRVRLQEGPAAGSTIEQVVPIGPDTPAFAVHDAVVLAYSGSDPTSPSSYRIVDFQRGGWLLALAALFAAAVLVLGRWRGLLSLAALLLSFTVLVGFVFPAILAGRDPLAVAVVGAGLIMFTVLYLTHGASAQTSTAVLGTLVSLSVIGVLSALFSALTDLTGLNENTSTLVNALGSDVDPRGLLLAGVVIGALGVLDDVTVTQTSVVWELRRTDPALTWRELYGAGLRIGRDHVASAVNTLVLAYAGTSLPLLLAYSLSGHSFTAIVTSQAVAQEVVRTLVGSIGLVAAVPATTAIAAAVARSDTDAGRPADPGATPSILEVVRRAAAEGATRRTVPIGRPPASRNGPVRSLIASQDVGRNRVSAQSRDELRDVVGS